MTAEKLSKLMRQSRIKISNSRTPVIRLSRPETDDATAHTDDLERVFASR
jgi:hypothetical protein